MKKLPGPVAALERKPNLLPDLAIVWRCFSNLHRARLVGLAPMGIQTSEIVAWLDLYRIEGESRLIIYELVSALDVVWLREQKDG